MAGVLIAMKWRMLRHATTGTRAAVTGTGATIGLLLAVAGIIVELATGGRSAGVALTVTSLWTVGWLFGGIVSGGESVLKVRLLGLLPLRPRQMATGMYAAAFVGVGPAVTLIAFGGVLLPLGLRSGVGAALLALPAIVLQLAFVVLAARVLVDLLGSATRGRLGAELASILFGFVLAFLYAGWGLLGHARGALDAGTPVLRLLPSAWGADAVNAAGHGDWLGALGLLAALAALVVLLVPVWGRLLARRVVDTGSGGGARRPLGRRLLPATPLCATLGKELRTWFRDPARGRMARMALWGGVFFIPFSLAGMGFYLPWVGGITVLYASAFCSNLYGFDGSALWLVISAPGGVRADVRGRQLGWLAVIGLPSLVFTVVGLALYGQAWAWPWGLGLWAALAGASTGFVLLYPVLLPAPMNDPHKRARGTMLSGDDMDAGRTHVLGQLTFWSSAGAAVPPVILLAVGTAADSPALTWCGAALGAVIGASLAWFLGRLTQHRLTRTGPELVAALKHGPTASVASSTPGAKPAADVKLPARVTVPAGLLMIVGVLGTFPQGGVPLVFSILGVSQHVRSWFLARYLPVPYQAPAALAFLVVGLVSATCSTVLIRRAKKAAARTLA